MCFWEVFWLDPSDGFFACDIGNEDYCVFYEKITVHHRSCKFRENGLRECHCEAAIADASVDLRLEQL